MHCKKEEHGVSRTPCLRVALSYATPAHLPGLLVSDALSSVAHKPLDPSLLQLLRYRIRCDTAARDIDGVRLDRYSESDAMSVE
jgi:hypothetical protein